MKAFLIPLIRMNHCPFQVPLVLHTHFYRSIFTALYHHFSVHVSPHPRP